MESYLAYYFFTVGISSFDFIGTLIGSSFHIPLNRSACYNSILLLLTYLLTLLQFIQFYPPGIGQLI